jgi:hypothetical protein
MRMEMRMRMMMRMMVKRVRRGGREKSLLSPS